MKSAIWKSIGFHVFLLVGIWGVLQRQERAMTPAPSRIHSIQAETIGAEQLQAQVNRLAREKALAQKRVQAQQQALDRRLRLAKQRERTVLDATKTKEAHLKKMLKQEKPLSARWEKTRREQAKQQAAIKKKALTKPQVQIGSRISLPGEQIAPSTLALYSQQIQQAIESNWRVPLGSPKGIACALDLHLAPNGDVLSAKVHGPVLDQQTCQSALAAVYASAPLPVPSDPKIFQHFRDVELSVSPRNA